MNGHIFKTDRLSAGYDKRTVISDVGITVPDGKISVIIGANACGKSTLLKALVRLIKPGAGIITLDDKPIEKIPPKKLARTIGLLPQSPIVPEGIAVADLVGRGRYPHQSFLKGWSREDTLAVARALDMMGISELANRSIDELSGGQRQRVWIAMALAQETDILFLDEPTTFLDITYQIEILDILTDLNQAHKTTIVMVLHDINLAARYADYIFAVHGGKIACEGAPQHVVTRERIKDIFQMNCKVISDPVSGTPFVIPMGRHHAGE
ncbi:MAG: ABC transporter ATP-binding protein [Oscillospiraceae bacterium]|jgi:iron complex transport system ATP-binding protein|nr:ABC transporter ATP-binding protein [Oscillospiraceae bacterium]